MKPRSSSTHRPHVGARRAVGEERPDRLAQGVLIVRKREIHGAGAYRRNLTRVLAFAAVMDFSFTAEDEAFRDELRAWLDVNLTKFLEDWDADDDPGGGQVSGFDRTQERRKDWQRRLNEGRWAAINWPKEWNGREATPVQNASVRRGDGARARAGHLQHERHLADRPDDHQVGHARAAAALAARHPQRRRALVPGLQRARGRLGPRQHAHDGDPRRRPTTS